MARWTAKDSSIDISAPNRPGVGNCDVIDSVKFNGEFYQRVFAVVWLYKNYHEQDHFGNRTQV